MKNLAVFAFGVTLLFPAISSAAPLTNEQATSLISVVQSSPGTNPSAFVPLITAFSNITMVQAVSLINVVQQSLNTPASAFISLLVSFTADPVVVQQPVVVPPVTPDPVLGTIVPTPQPTPQPTPTPVPTPVPVVVVPQGVTEQVGYNIEYEQRVVNDSLAEAAVKCADGKIDIKCNYLYGQATDFQNLLNLVRSQYSTHRTASCDLNLSQVYNNLEVSIVSYYMNLTNLASGPHTVSYSQGMQAKYLSDYQDRTNQYLPQAQQISSTCFGV